MELSIFKENIKIIDTNPINKKIIDINGNKISKVKKNNSQIINAIYSKDEDLLKDIIEQNTYTVKSYVYIYVFSYISDISKDKKIFNIVKNNKNISAATIVKELLYNSEYKKLKSTLNNFQYNDLLNSLDLKEKKQNATIIWLKNNKEETELEYNENFLKTFLTKEQLKEQKEKIKKYKKKLNQIHNIYNSKEDLKELKEELKELKENMILDISFSNGIFSGEQEGVLSDLLNDKDFSFFNISFEKAIFENSDVNFTNTKVNSLSFKNARIENSRINISSLECKESISFYDAAILTKEDSEIESGIICKNNKIEEDDANSLNVKDTKLDSILKTKYKRILGLNECSIDLRRIKLINSKIEFYNSDLFGYFNMNELESENSTIEINKCIFNERNDCKLFLNKENEESYDKTTQEKSNNKTATLTFERIIFNKKIKENKNIKDRYKKKKEFIFQENTINGNISFRWSEFYSLFDFSNTKINYEKINIMNIGDIKVDFNNTIFNDKAILENIDANSGIEVFISFIYSLINKDLILNFKKIESNVRISFEKAKINRIDLTEIENIDNLKELSFNGAIFENTPLIKNDYRCVINFINSNVEDIEVKEITSHIKPEKEDRQSIIKLKKLAEDSGDIDTSVRLGGIEMSLREGKRNGFFNFLYEWTSRKGKSIGIPLLWLAYWDLIFIILYSYIIEKTENVIPFTLLNNIPFIAILRNPNKDYFKEFYPAKECLEVNLTVVEKINLGLIEKINCGEGFVNKGILAIPPEHAFLIFLHLIFSFILVFLIGLGIRNRFRLK